MYQPPRYQPSTRTAGRYPGAPAPTRHQDSFAPSGPAGLHAGNHPSPDGPHPPGDSDQARQAVPRREPPKPIPRRRSKVKMLAVVALLAGATGLGAFLLLDDGGGETETTGLHREDGRSGWISGRS